jgi:tRNA U34 5-methylaminomethyl-2-thiouridine-forming methyltransferase MnmC
MKKEIIVTKDGSPTIAIPELHATYHSIHGAIRESMHVFIQEGLHYFIKHNSHQPIRIFEMGFGTGLNAFLTAIEAEKNDMSIQYTAIEQHPLSVEEWKQLNYGASLGNEELFEKIHNTAWNNEVEIMSNFILRKEHNDLTDYATPQQFNIIYYDAFAPSAQPHLWTKEVFEKLLNLLSPNGILVTYCSKGNVKRAMMAAGFSLEKVQGPPGKREMVRAAHPDLPGGKATYAQPQLI